MLSGTKKINELFEKDEFKVFLIEGDHGYGKSTYANRLIAEVYSLDKIRCNWDYKKKNSVFPMHIGFHPKHVIDLWSKQEKRDYCFHWDDAGLWLHSMEFYDPFVKEVGKYMQVARTDWAALIFTAISKEDIISKIRGLRNTIVIEITKDSNYKEPYRRLATAYIQRKTWKGRYWKDYLWKDRFNCHVPDDFYNEWYKPLRNKYSEIAKNRMRNKLNQHPDFKDEEDNI